MNASLGGPLNAPPKAPSPFGDRFWRFLALFALCFLVYYFSYDHGRTTAKARLEREIAENQALRIQLALQSQEIEKYKTLFEGGKLVKAEVAKEPGKEPGKKPAKNAPGRKFAARVAEDKNFFDDRLILTVVDVNNLDQEATVRLFYVDKAYREATLVKVGQNLTVKLNNQESQFFLDQLKGSVAFFTFYENQSIPTKEAGASGSEPSRDPS
ncbi:MAG: hypothetical protein LBI10_06750 [Deltaproteobacteria bacterium]|nr:hypothetical protein [Deltaproteobacteria bacterium]